MPRSFLRTLLVLAACVSASSPVLAQDAGLVVPPKHTCKKPEFPGRLASERQMGQWRKETEAFGTCIRKYVEQQQKNAEAFVKAGNAAVDEYNEAIKSANEELKP